MEKINNDNFRASINRSLDDLFKVETMEDLDRTLAIIEHSIQSYARIQKDILEFNELYAYFENGETH